MLASPSTPTTGPRAQAHTLLRSSTSLPPISVILTTATENGATVGGKATGCHATAGSNSSRTTSTTHALFITAAGQWTAADTPSYATATTRTTSSISTSVGAAPETDSPPSTPLTSKVTTSATPTSPLSTFTLKAIDSMSGQSLTSNTAATSSGQAPSHKARRAP